MSTSDNLDKLMKLVGNIILTTFLCLFITCTCYAQHSKLRAAIDKIARSTNGRVGVAISLLEDNDTITYHNNEHYVMHSIAKFAVALDMLHAVDIGKFSLNQSIYITKSDLPKTYSPLRDKYPSGDVNIKINELLSYMIALSDNDACDILYHLLGGTKHVEDFLHGIGIKQVQLKATEKDMTTAWLMQYKNWIEPYEQVKLLKFLYDGSLLSKKSNEYLWKIMLATTTAPKRIKGLLPENTKVAHKTGTSGTNDKGLSPATNDSGIIILPNGKHLAVAIFITDATDDAVARDLVIAQIAQAAFNEFSRL